MEWIECLQNRVLYRTLGKMLMQILVSANTGEFLDYFRNYELLSEVPAHGVGCFYLVRAVGKLIFQFPFCGILQALKTFLLNKM